MRGESLALQVQVKIGWWTRGAARTTGDQLNLRSNVEIIKDLLPIALGQETDILEKIELTIEDLQTTIRCQLRPMTGDHLNSPSKLLAPLRDRLQEIRDTIRGLHRSPAELMDRFLEIQYTTRGVQQVNRCQGSRGVPVVTRRTEAESPDPADIKDNLLTICISSL